MNINIEEIAENFLWDKISWYVEQVKELKIMIKDIGYIDKNIVEQVKWCEVFDTEEFIVCRVEETKQGIAIEFKMPFILACWNDREQEQKQLLRVTAEVSGVCNIPDEESFDYSLLDFVNTMQTSELLKKLEALIKISDIAYSGVEVDMCL